MSKIQLSFIDDNLTDDIIEDCKEIADSKNIDTFAITPTYLDIINKKAPSNNVNLLIDFPWPLQEVEVLNYAINYYKKKYSQITMVTFGGYLLQYTNQAWKQIRDISNILVETCKKNKIAPYFFTDLNMLTDSIDLQTIGGISEESGCAGIIIGAESAGSVSDLLIEAHGLSKSVSIPVGIISYAENKEEMETLMNSTFSPKLLLAENILSFVWD